MRWRDPIMSQRFAHILHYSLVSRIKNWVFRRIQIIDKLKANIWKFARCYLLLYVSHELKRQFKVKPMNVHLHSLKRFKYSLLHFYQICIPKHGYFAKYRLSCNFYIRCFLSLCCIFQIPHTTHGHWPCMSFLLLKVGIRCPFRARVEKVESRVE